MSENGEKHTIHIPGTPSGIPVAQQLLLLVLILTLLLGNGVTAVKIAEMFGEQLPQAQAVQSTGEIPIFDTTPDDPFAHIKIEGRAAYVWDVREQRVLYKQESDEVLPLASITKLMTALVADKLLTDSDDIVISYADILQDGESGLKPGETFNTEALNDLVLMTSSNDGAFALAKAAGANISEEAALSMFLGAMNLEAETIGLSDTQFLNPTGLDLSVTQSGGYGTARDVSFLMEHILLERPHILERTREDLRAIYNNAGDYHTSQNTNDVTHNIDGLLGSKTGYTSLAGGNLVIAFDAGLNRPVIVTVLGSSRAGRFEDVTTLSEAARMYVNSN